jgi:hypothetical protein
MGSWNPSKDLANFLCMIHSLTCRQRKLKCDEEKPVCGQCRKGSRECQPSDGVVFRHQQNASMNGRGDVEDNGGKLAGFYAYRNSFNEHNVWVEVPKRGSQISSMEYIEQRADNLLSNVLQYHRSVQHGSYTRTRSRASTRFHPNNRTRSRGEISRKLFQYAF